MNSDYTTWITLRKRRRGGQSGGTSSAIEVRRSSAKSTYTEFPGKSIAKQKMRSDSPTIWILVR